MCAMNAPAPQPPPATPALRPAAVASRAPITGRVIVCDICGHPATELHCKVRCFNCGFTRDCSDP